MQSIVTTRTVQPWCRSGGQRFSGDAGVGEAVARSLALFMQQTGQMKKHEGRGCRYAQQDLI